ncbi:helix-turn-helix domain-containing protein [Pseudochryseolinea flava]|nr:helix-turn-helix domain-containing protein [Pseudochryseolinea flava]
MEPKLVVTMTVTELKSLINETISTLLDERGLNKNGSETLLNVQEAAALLSLAVPTLYEKTSTRIIPHYKHGKKLLFKKSELLAWVESTKRKTVHELKQEALRRTLKQT